MKSIVIQDYGGYRFIYKLALELSKTMKLSYIYCSTSGGANSDYKSIGNLTAVDLKMSNYNKSNFFFRKINERSYGKKVVDQLKGKQIDCLISTNTPLDAQKIINKNFTEAPHIIWVQDLLSIAISSILSEKIPFFGSMIGRYYHRIEKKCYETADKLITISDQLEKKIISWDISTIIEVLPNWAPVEEIKVNPKNNSFSRKHGLEKKFVVLYSGSLGMKHDPDLIVNAVRKQKENKNIAFLIISEGMGADYLKRKKGELKLDNLMILDFQPNGIYNDVLSTADLNLILLNAEAQKYSVPSKAWSAMCSGRPLLTNMSKNNQVSQIIEKTNSGIVLHSDQTISDGISQLYNNPKLCEQMSRNSRKYAENNFRLEEIAKAFIKKAEIG